MNERVIHLASSSATRQTLLRNAQIDFELLTQTADENIDSMMFANKKSYILAIVAQKLASILFPTAHHEYQLCVVVADTILETPRGEILHKPKNFAEAYAMVHRVSAEPMTVLTGIGVCVFEMKNAEWKGIHEQREVVATLVDFHVPDNEIEIYLKKNPAALNACGATVIEGHAARYVKEIRGSYTNILGLPLDVLRTLLMQCKWWY